MRRESRAGRWMASLALMLFVALLLAPPHTLLDKADLTGYAVCHRIPERTFFFAGRQLPLCARCTGTYLGACAGLTALFLRKRSRCAGLPFRASIPIFTLFVGGWALDGINSYLTLFPGLPHLYAPSNILRLVTGTLAGVTLASYLLPFLNSTVWRCPALCASISGRGDIAAILIAATTVVSLVGSGIPFLLYPLALLSGAAIVTLLGAVNGLLMIVLLRRENAAASWRELIAPLAGGVSIAIVEILLVAMVRSWLTTRLGLPF